MLKRYTDFTDKPQDNLLETISNPNFSIVVPGGCNGNCEFCFWKNDKACGNYTQQLRETLDSMPSQFYQLSLTGGEPTLSPYFEDILENINTDKWTHTVLTTNGTNLKKYIPQLEGKIQHVNISRHHYDEKVNESVFDSVSIPSNDKIRELVVELNKVGIDVTFSAVLTEHLSTKEDIKKYIKFAKSHGVKQVFFRKQHGTLDPSDAEKAFEHLPQHHHTCPVCRNTTQEINETTVVWKASVEEPSKELGMIYEVIYNQNGTLTTDWEQELIIESKQIQNGSESLLEECGSSSSGCGGGRSSDDYEYRGPTEEELRLMKLKERERKVKKVVGKVKKQIAEDSKVDTEDTIDPKPVQESKEEQGGHAVITIDHLDGNYKGKKLNLPENEELTRKRFKLYDDDDELYYSGYFYDDPSCENQDTLLRWAMGDSGCTLIKVAVGRGPFEVEIG